MSSDPAPAAVCEALAMLSLAIGQFSATADTAENLAAVRRFAAGAADDGAGLLVLPEYTSYTPPKLDERLHAHAEPLDGPFATAVRAAAGERGIAIVVGMVEAVPGEARVHNTLLLVDQRGELVATYRKLHLYDAFGLTESDWIAPGDPTVTPTMEIGGIGVGAQTCYDLRFPETTRVLVDAGAQVVVVPAQWVPGPRKEDHWSTLLRARAIENTIYVAAAGQSAPTGAGSSMVVDPMGVVVAGLGDRVGLATAVIDPDRIDAVRATNPVLAARRFRVVGDPQR